MELVPILSTIILVGTIATFILAVFAYILYKVRERRTREAAPQGSYVEARRQQPTMAPGRPISTPMGHPGDGSMYLAPTTTLPSQGPVVELEDPREAVPPPGGWSQPPSLERAVAAPRASEHEGANGHRRPPQRAVHPPYEPAEAPAREPSSLFWEYTDEGFIPVDPTKAPPREGARMEGRSRDDDEEATAWL